MTRTTNPPDAAPPETGEPSGGTPDSPARRTPIVLLAVSSVALIVALILAVVFGLQWLQASGDTTTARDRDDALAGARQAAINLNSVDSNNLDQTFADIESSITGDELVNGLNDTKDQFRQQFASSGVVTTANVQHAALVGFSEDEGTAASLVILQTDTKRPDGEDLFLTTLRLEMQDVDGVWKASKIQPIGQRIPLANPDAAAADPNAAPADPNAAPAPADPNAADPNATPAPAPAPADPAAPSGGQ